MLLFILIYITGLFVTLIFLWFILYLDVLLIFHLLLFLFRPNSKASLHDLIRCESSFCKIFYQRTIAPRSVRRCWFLIAIITIGCLSNSKCPYRFRRNVPSSKMGTGLPSRGKCYQTSCVECSCGCVRLSYS